MLHVKIELVPMGIEAGRETLNDIYIANDGTGEADHGNYDVYTQDPRGQEYPRNTRDGWVGGLQNYPRKTEVDRLELVEAAVAVVRQAHRD